MRFPRTHRWKGFRFQRRRVVVTSRNRETYYATCGRIVTRPVYCLKLGRPMAITFISPLVETR